MTGWTRRLRAAIGLGVTWAMVWFGAGLLMLAVVGFGAADVPFPLMFGLLGFVAGVAFSLILGIAEGRRRFGEISLRRSAAWGGSGGSFLALAMVPIAGWESLPVLALIFPLSGAACAAATLALARRGEEAGELAGGARVDRLRRGE